MAIYHLTMKNIQRARGQSAVASAAYRARTRLHDQRTGLLHDYRRYRGGPLLAEACLAPDGTVLNRERLWNAAELADNRKNSMTAREVEVALPAELSQEEQVALALEYAQGLATRHRCAVDVAVHGPDPQGDIRNVHAHILITTREYDGLGADGIPVLGAKNRDFSFDGRALGKPHGVEIERQEWEKVCNLALERAGVLERIDHRSLAAQGISRAPGIHLGPAVMAMERRGIETERGAMARESVEALEIEGLIAQIEQELAKEPVLTPSSAHRRGSRTHDVEPTGTKPFMEENHPSKKGVFEVPLPEEILLMALGDPTKRVRQCQAYQIPGRTLGSVEALKGAGLEPALIVMGDEGVAVVLKADRALGREAREALTQAVQETVPGAEPSPTLPRDGLVLEARGVVCTRAKEIIRDVEKGRGPEL